MAIIVVASFENAADAHNAAGALEGGGFLKQEITVRPFDPDTVLGDPDTTERMAEPGWDGLLNTLQRTPQHSSSESETGELRNRECLVMVTSDEDRRADDATRILSQFHPREVVGRIAGNGTVDVLAESVAKSAVDSIAVMNGLDTTLEDSTCIPRASDGRFAECDVTADEELHSVNK